MKTRLKLIEPYMQHCIRATFSNPQYLPDTVLLLPSVYSEQLRTAMGLDLEMLIDDHGKLDTEHKHLIRLNVIVVQARHAANDHWEYCLSAGGNVCTIVMGGEKLPPDTACSLSVSFAHENRHHI